MGNRGENAFIVEMRGRGNRPPNALNCSPPPLPQWYVMIAAATIVTPMTGGSCIIPLATLLRSSHLRCARYLASSVAPPAAAYANAAA